MADDCPDCRGELDPVLADLTLSSGLTAARWLWAPGAAAQGGHAVVAPGGRLVIHPGDGTPSATLGGAANALPLSDKSVGTLVVPLLLPVLEDIDGLFAELRRVLRPHGLVTMLVPGPPSFGWRGRGLRAEVRRHWRNRSAIDHPDWLAAAADFAVLGDDRLVFTMTGDTGPHPHGAVVDRLCTAGLHPPELPTDVRGRVAAHHAARAGRPMRVGLRRLVARR